MWSARSPGRSCPVRVGVPPSTEPPEPAPRGTDAPLTVLGDVQAEARDRVDVPLSPDASFGVSTGSATAWLARRSRTDPTSCRTASARSDADRCADAQVRHVDGRGHAVVLERADDRVAPRRRRAVVLLQRRQREVVAVARRRWIARRLDGVRRSLAGWRPTPARARASARSTQDQGPSAPCARWRRSRRSIDDDAAAPSGPVIGASTTTASARRRTGKNRRRVTRNAISGQSCQVGLGGYASYVRPPSSGTTRSRNTSS